MKTLFVSLAFFLFADKDLLTTSKPSSINAEGIITFAELLKLRSESPASIEKKLIPRNWINRTEEQFKKGNLAKGECLWSLSDPKASLLYEVVAYDERHEAPVLKLAFSSDKEYEKLIDQARNSGIGLKECSSDEHEGDDEYEPEYHFFNAEYDILFTDLDGYRIRVGGKKKK